MIYDFSLDMIYILVMIYMIYVLNFLGKLELNRRREAHGLLPLCRKVCSLQEQVFGSVLYSMNKVMLIYYKLGGIKYSITLLLNTPASWEMV